MSTKNESDLPNNSCTECVMNNHLASRKEKNQDTTLEMRERLPDQRNRRLRLFEGIKRQNVIEKRKTC